MTANVTLNKDFLREILKSDLTLREIKTLLAIVLLRSEGGQKISNNDISNVNKIDSRICSKSRNKLAEKKIIIDDRSGTFCNFLFKSSLETKCVKSAQMRQISANAPNQRKCAKLAQMRQISASETIQLSNQLNFSQGENIEQKQSIDKTLQNLSLQKNQKLNNKNNALARILNKNSPLYLNSLKDLNKKIKLNISNHLEPREITQVISRAKAPALATSAAMPCSIASISDTDLSVNIEQQAEMLSDTGDSKYKAKKTRKKPNKLTIDEIMNAELPAQIQREDWTRYIVYRIEKENLFKTKSGLTQTINRLVDFFKKGADISKVINNCIANEWEGVHFDAKKQSDLMRNDKPKSHLLVGGKDFVQSANFLAARKSKLFID